MRAVFQMCENCELEDTKVDDMCKRARKEIANLFYTFDGYLFNASRTVRSK